MKNAPNAITRNKAGLAARKTYKKNKKDKQKFFISKAMIKKFIGNKKKRDAKSMHYYFINQPNTFHQFIYCRDRLSIEMKRFQLEYCFEC